MTCHLINKAVMKKNCVEALNQHAQPLEKKAAFSSFNKKVLHIIIIIIIWQFIIIIVIIGNLVLSSVGREYTLYFLASYLLVDYFLIFFNSTQFYCYCCYPPLVFTARQVKLSNNLLASLGNFPDCSSGIYYSIYYWNFSEFSSRTRKYVDTQRTLVVTAGVAITDWERTHRIEIVYILTSPYSTKLQHRLHTSSCGLC